MPVQVSVLLMKRSGRSAASCTESTKVEEHGRSALNATPDELRRQLEVAERNRILQALDACAGNQTRAAKMLGISRRTLVSRLDAYGIARPRKNPSRDG